MDPNEAVRAYGEAWGDVDDAKRRELLEAAWADEGVYCDPTATVSGRGAVAAHIAGFAERMAGHSIVVTSGVDAHDGFARFGWEMRDAGGEVAMEGIDFATFGPDGRIERIVGFFGPLPPLG